MGVALVQKQRAEELKPPAIQMVNIFDFQPGLMLSTNPHLLFVVLDVLGAHFLEDQPKNVSLNGFEPTKFNFSTP